MINKNSETTISLKEYPSPHYKKFFDKFPEIETLPPNNWDATHIIAYFCKKYKDLYKLDYTFKFNSTAPSKSYEVFQIRKLSSMLSADPIILKDYIDWFFYEKIITKKRRITSMAFMTDANIVNEYKNKKLLLGRAAISRTTTIPPNFVDIIHKHGLKLTTYGELSFVKRSIEANEENSENSENIKYKNLLNDLKQSGMDISMLDRVK